MHSARVSIGNTSLAVRYAELAPAEAKKNTTIPKMVSVMAVSPPEAESGDRQQHVGESLLCRWPGAVDRS